MGDGRGTGLPSADTRPAENWPGMGRRPRRVMCGLRLKCLAHGSDWWSPGGVLARWWGPQRLSPFEGVLAPCPVF